MVKFTFAAILAASIVAPALGAAISFDRLETRDVANTDSELFGRAVAEAFNDLYSREELSELVGRDIEEFTTRDLEELMEREFDVDEEMIARDLLDVADELDVRTPIFGWIKKKLGFGKPKEEEVAARDFIEEEIVEARDSMADHDLEARAPIFGWIKKKLGFGKPKVPTEEVAAREFDDELLEARAEAAPRQPNIIEKFLNLFRNKNHPGAKKAAAEKKAGGAAPAAPAAPAAEAPAAEAPAAREFLDLEEREFDDEYLFEREYENAWEDVLEREYEEDMFERDFDEEVFEREYEFDELD